MPILLHCLSHSPLMPSNRPPAETEAAVRASIATARAEVERFAPELAVVFAPDHFNAFFYDFMPPFCLGVAADSVGDYGTPAGALTVPATIAVDCAEAVLQAGVDLTLSYRMQVDHGFSQPLELLAGRLDRFPVLPIFVNGAAPPRPPCARVRLLGEAVGRYLATHHAHKRILILGSGGISHDPPIPAIGTAPPEVRERLIAGRNPPPEVQRAKEQRVIQAGQDFAAADPRLGGGALLPLNPEWDHHVLEALRTRDTVRMDAWRDDWITAQGGRGGHEIRAWIAAFACLSAFGPYAAEVTCYRAIPEWIAGFAMMRATPAAQAAALAA